MIVLKEGRNFTSEEVLKIISEMDNGERIDLLKALYYKHFDRGIIKEQVEEERRILRMYYDGALIEVDEDEY